MHSFSIPFDEHLVIETLKKIEARDLSSQDDNSCYLKLAVWMFEAEQQRAMEQLKVANRYLEELAHREGILELEAGKLYIEKIKEGEGSMIVQEDTVPLMHITESILSGEMVRNTRKGLPIPIVVDETIPGFYREY